MAYYFTPKEKGADGLTGTERMAYGVFREQEIFALARAVR